MKQLLDLHQELGLRTLFLLIACISEQLLFFFKQYLMKIVFVIAEIDLILQSNFLLLETNNNHKYYLAEEQAMKPIIPNYSLKVTQQHKFWNNRENKKRQKNGVHCLSMLNDYLIAGDESGCLRLYSFENEEQDRRRKIAGHSHMVCCIAIISDTVVASGSQGELNSIRVWNIADGTCLATLKGHKNTVSALIVLNQGRILASSSYDGTIKIWDWSQKQQEEIREIRAHGYPILRMIKSQDEKMLLSGGDDYRIKIWDTANFACIRVLEAHIGYISALCWIGSDKFASGSSSGEIFIWSLDDIRTGNIESPLLDKLNHSQNIQGLCYLSKRGILVGVSQDRKIKFWETGTGKLLYIIEEAHQDTINAIAASRDQLSIMTGCWDGLIKIWKIQ